MHRSITSQAGHEAPHSDTDVQYSLPICNDLGLLIVGDFTSDISSPRYYNARHGPGLALCAQFTPYPYMALQ
jgi:hypothetical protein